MAGEITRISHGLKTTMTTHGQTIQTTSNILIILPIINPTFQITSQFFQPSTQFFKIINKTFPIKLNNLPSKILHLRRE